MSRQNCVYHQPLLLLTFLLVLLIAGCLPTRQQEVTAALPLNENLPPSWTPLNDVQPINIDGDAAAEYLLYFTYDGSSGPVGAVIYNTETDEDPVSDDAAASRLSTSFIPYAVLPSYRPGAGQGFIAEPSQRNAVGTFPISFHGESINDTTIPVVADALAILGGTNYLTWVWWQAQSDSYGVTQLYAADRFETAAQDAFDWDTWRAAPTPIEDIVTVHPLGDRNQLCRRKRHLLVAPAQKLATTQVLDMIQYREYDLGISFCRAVPERPFYPEGVVMAYLATGSTTYWDQDKLDTATIQERAARVVQSTIIRINDLAGYKTIQEMANAQARNSTQPSKPVETRVCVELIMSPTFTGSESQPVTVYDVLTDETSRTLVDQEDGPRFLRRWLLFTLRHEPPHREPATEDRLYINNVEVLPVLPANGAVDCKERLEG